jgi:hypothetical protein
LNILQILHDYGILGNWHPDCGCLVTLISTLFRHGCFCCLSSNAAQSSVAWSTGCLLMSYYVHMWIELFLEIFLCTQGTQMLLFSNLATDVQQRGFYLGIYSCFFAILTTKIPCLVASLASPKKTSITPIAPLHRAHSFYLFFSLSFSLLLFSQFHFPLFYLCFSLPSPLPIC